jgi:hypothetical protein
VSLRAFLYTCAHYIKALLQGLERGMHEFDYSIFRNEHPSIRLTLFAINYYPKKNNAECQDSYLFLINTVSFL